MKNWTIGKRILFGFSTVISITGLLGAFAYVELTAIRFHTTDIATNWLPGVHMLGEIKAASHEHFAILGKHILADTKEETIKHEAALVTAGAGLDKLFKDYEPAVLDPREKPMFAAVQTARAAYETACQPVRTLSLEIKTKEATTLYNNEVAAAFKKYAELIEVEAVFNKTNADLAGAKSLSAANTAVKSIVIGVLGALAIGIALALVIIRSTAKVLTGVAASLSQGAEQVAAAAGQVSASSQSLAEGASEQAASLEETSASIEEMSSMTKRNAENAQKANDLARQTRASAEKGSTDMQAMSAAMTAIKASSDEISKIIKTIDEIAFQTNILALNAAVEAARAGEAGMGFAVVADEVRNLAQRSAQAAKETSLKIEGAITRTEQGVDLSGKVAQALTDIVTQVRQVDELVAEVAGASREQSTGISQVNLAVSQMDKVTQTTAANAEESAAASEELNAQAHTMKNSVAELMQIVGARSAADVGHPLAAKKPPQEPSFCTDQLGAMSLPQRPRTVTTVKRKPISAAACS